MADHIPDEYGFTVRHGGGGWTVSLPHQCDSWDIAGAVDWADGAVPHEEAVERLRRFVAEAQNALAHLERGDVLNVPDDDQSNEEDPCG